MEDTVAFGGTANARAPRLNALIMDGGGVRGLSSLLILRQLMILINTCLLNQGFKGRAEPRDIFGFAAGTSTGGLIAIMLTRLNMGIDECIDEYRQLSQEIFKRKRLRGKVSGGLYRARYRGGKLRDCVRRLLKKRGLSEDEPLVWSQEETDSSAPSEAIPTPRHKMHCSVVCREHENKSKFSDLLDDPVCLCSTDCGHQFDCRICDAARATSAAWTYFPLTEIGQRYFSDGGVEYNNPSFVIWNHYTVADETRRIRSSYNHPKEPMPPIPTHPGIDFSHCRIVNIGTGSYVSNVTPPRERDKFATFIPEWVLFGLFLKRTLTKVATTSDRVAEQMRTEEKVWGGDLLFDRLSATNGVCWIKLDRYLQLNEIEQLTSDWLAKRETVAYMSQLASAMAKEYLDAHPSERIERASNLNGLASAGIQAAADTVTSGHMSATTNDESEGHAGADIPDVQLHLPQQTDMLPAASSTSSSVSLIEQEPQAQQPAQPHQSDAQPVQRPTWLSANPQISLRSQSV